MVCGGLKVFWGGLEVIWGVLGWFGVSLRSLFCLFLSGRLRQVLLCMARGHRLEFLNY